MEKSEIVAVLRDLHRMTGFRVSLHGADYGEIAAYPKEKSRFCRAVHGIAGELDRCISCDKAASERALSIKDTYIYRCRYGMVEAISPLYNFGVLTGFLMMGQVMDSTECRDALCKDICTAKSASVAKADVLREIRLGLAETPIVAPEMVESYVRIMTICARYLTLSNALPVEKPTVSGMAMRYIHDNLSRKLTLKDICEEIGCSKSTLINAFKYEVGTTVNQYITEMRVSEAAAMLRMGKETVSAIAAATGFSDQSYFSKVFTKRYGVSPREYADGSGAVARDSYDGYSADGGEKVQEM